MREIQFRPSIAEHDYQVKLNKIRDLLQKSNQVKTTVLFRGRERTHPELGEHIITKLIVDLSDFGQIAHGPKIESSRMYVTFNPRKR